MGEKKERINLEYLKVKEEIKQALCNVERKTKQYKRKKEQEENER